MTVMLTAFLILVPAPTADEVPSGAAPNLQYMKLVNGAFETNVFIKRFVPVTKSIAVNVNGKMEVRTYTTLETVTEVVRQMVDVKGAEFYSLEGKKLDEAAWKKALGNGGIVIVASDGQLPHPGFLKVIREGTLIMVTKPILVTPPPPVPIKGPPRD